MNYLNITNKTLYNELSKSSLQIAHRRTIEESALLMADEISEYLKQKK